MKEVNPVALFRLSVLGPLVVCFRQACVSCLVSEG